MQKENKAPKKTREAGFTLLEIIAVLVIMSILAVVAVPKYFDLQEKARERAMETAVAEGISRINGYFAKQVLSGSMPGEINYTTENLGSFMGDFTLEIGNGDANATGPISITVKGIGTAVLDMVRTTTVQRPGSF